MASSYAPTEREKPDAGGDSQYNQSVQSCEEYNKDTDEQESERHEFLIGNDMEFFCKETSDEEGEEKR